MFLKRTRMHQSQTEDSDTVPPVLFKSAIRTKKSKNSFDAAEGIPWIWVCAGALVTILLMICALFGVIISQGLVALWPRDIIQVQTNDVSVLGLSMRQEDGTDTESGEKVVRKVIYQANRDFGVNEFAFVPAQITETAEKPSHLWFVERREWGPFIGKVQKISSSSGSLADIPAEELQQMIERGYSRKKAIKAIEKNQMAEINNKIEALRLDARGIEQKLETGQLTEESGSSQIDKINEVISELTQSHEEITAQVQILQTADENITVTLLADNGQSKVIPASQLLRAFKPNELGIAEKIGVFISRLWEFISEEPREANTEGGVFPALFGTVAMTIIMTVFVLPVGVITAVYMREIAKQGLLVSLVRIAVNNLAGVPSIVYGVFGVGFFCYTIGASIDQLFFEEKLPNPTYGTGGILWASLTLAMLTVPVVIVSTEEALSAVPRSLREASYGCGATRMQTLWNIVLPKALPGVMTGLILAMARAVGEVAPLLMTGVVKLAPALPIDSQFPFIHLERSFMHLGFHIYDLGFQSRSTELSRPMVFASTTLLVAVVLLLNFFAIKVRSQLRKRFEGRGAF
ncbi:MAG: phosphate transporter, permease protein PstA [Pseudomonadota bacterium]